MINEFDVHNVVCVVPPLLYYSIINAFAVLHGSAATDRFVLHANKKSVIILINI